MAELATSKKARWQACLRILSELNLEAWVKVGLTLTEIRDDRLYEEGGYEDFTEFLRETTGEFALSKRYAYNLIEGARIRPMLPECSVEHAAWTERNVRELGRLPTDAKIKQVANRALKRAENNGIGLGTAVRECVEDEVFTREQTKQTKRKKKEPPTFAEFLRTKTEEFGALADAIEEVDDAYLREFVDDHGITTKDLKAEMSRLHKQFNRIWTYLP